jgi:hypothetical protein
MIKYSDQHKPKMLRKGVSVFLELFFIFIVLVTAVGGAVIWRLSQGDLDAGFIKDNLEEAINDEIAPYQVESRHISLNWDNIFKRPVFSVKDLRFRDPQDGDIFKIDEIRFTLSRSNLVLAKIVPRRIDVEGVDLHVRKMEDQSVHIGFLSGPGILLSGGEPTAAFPDEVSMRHVFEESIEPLLKKSFLKGLSRIYLGNSFMVYEDLASGQAISFPGLELLLDRSRDHIELEMGVTFASYSDSMSDGHFDVTSVYNINPSILDVHIAMEEFNPFLWGRIFKSSALNADKSRVFLTGEADIRFDDTFEIDNSYMAVKASNGRIDIPEMYTEPFNFDELAFSGTYRPDENIFQIRKGELSAYGMDLGFEGDVPLVSDDKTDYEVPLKITSQDFLLPLPEKAYPDSLEHEKAYEWLTHKLAAGTVTNFELALVLKFFRDPNGEWDGDAKDIHAQFSFKDLKVIYKSTLMPLTHASGSGVLDGSIDKLKITGDSGNFEDIDLSDITVTVDRLLAKETGFVTVETMAKGKLGSVFRYLEPEPIGFAEKMDVDAEKVRGNADLKVLVGLPTSEDPKLAEMTIDISGAATDVYVPGLVNKMDVRGGPMQITVKDNLATVEGSGELDKGYPAKFKWERFLKSAGQPFKMKVAANLSSDHELRQKFGVDVYDYIPGPAKLDLTYIEFTDDNAEVDVKADLSQSEVLFTPLNYKKEMGSTASATLKAFLQDDQISEVKDLNIKGPDLDIQNASLTFKNGDLFKGVFPTNLINKTLGSCEFERPGQNVLKLRASGPVIDAGSFLEGPSDKPYDGPAIIASIKADKMLIKKDRFVENANIYIDMDQQRQMRQFEMDGKTGSGKIYIRYKPDSTGRTILRAEIDDAGAALKAFDIYETLEGGKLIATAVPTDEFWKGDLSGHVAIVDFTLVEAPLLARLISAVSLPGLAQLFGSEGIDFSRLEADFKWKSRPQGSLITISDGRTAGSELGLTFEGTIDRSKDYLDLSGTVVPVSTVNNIIGKIPLIGNVLTGGGGALIAATYTARGSAADPDVSINPLSVLAPGFLRRLFFEGGFDFDDE